MNWKKALTSIALAAFFVVTALLSHPVQWILVEDIDAGTLLHAERAPEGFTFATVIRHSVQKTPVYEYYRVERGGDITVVATKIQDLGWGMPSTLEREVRFEDGFMIMDHIDRTLKRLPFRISYIAEPELVLGGRRYDLTQYAEDSHRIDVYTERMSRIAFAFRRKDSAF